MPVMVSRKSSPCPFPAGLDQVVEKMQIVTDTGSLSALCERLATSEFVTIDTEFMRDSVYWPKLCLIQVAGDEDEAIIDPLADGIDLSPLYDLLRNETVLKVFHAARQDLEIFLHAIGHMPSPVFDTQIAAMVLGYGDQVGYDNLVQRICNKSIDKRARLTDWSRRPLTDKQLTYAMSDVTHLRKIYRQMKNQLEAKDRLSWLEDEMKILIDPETYLALTDPDRVWKRIKSKGLKPRDYGVLQEIAKWRELEAQERNVPRTRILKDEGLVEIATHPPKDDAALERIRMVPKGFGRSAQGKRLMTAVQAGLALPDSALPQKEKRLPPPRGIGPVMDLLRVLLKAKSEELEVAPRVLASSDDLEKIAAEDKADVPAMHGWRYEAFGRFAEDLKDGKLALSVGKKGVKIQIIG